MRPRPAVQSGMVCAMGEAGSTAARLRVFGLTGAFGSGKSTVARRLRARGVPVIDADTLAREVVAPGSEGLRQVVAAFGTSIVGDEGLDRKALGRVVFADPAARARLNAIVHPLVQRRRQELELELRARGEPLACYEVPLLYENGLERELSPVIVVSAPEALLVERAMRRDGLSEEAVRARLAAQLPLAEKVARADYVIDNSGLESATEARTDDVLRQICARLGVDPARYLRDRALST